MFLGEDVCEMQLDGDFARIFSASGFWDEASNFHIREPIEEGNQGLKIEVDDRCNDVRSKEQDRSKFLAHLAAHSK